MFFRLPLPPAVVPVVLILPLSSLPPMGLILLLILLLIELLLELVGTVGLLLELGDGGGLPCTGNIRELLLFVEVEGDSDDNDWVDPPLSKSLNEGDAWMVSLLAWFAAGSVPVPVLVPGAMTVPLSVPVPEGPTPVAVLLPVTVLAVVNTILRLSSSRGFLTVVLDCNSNSCLALFLRAVLMRLALCRIN